jgi:hypothetical protein
LIESKQDPSDPKYSADYPQDFQINSTARRNWDTPPGTIDVRSDAVPAADLDIICSWREQ